MSEEDWPFGRGILFPEKLKTWLDNGGDPNWVDSSGCTGLHVAAMAKHAVSLRILLDGGGDVHARDKNGMTPLHNAMAGSDHEVEVVKALIDAGADVNAKNKYGETALHLASRNGYEEGVKALLDAGVDMSAKDDDGSTALHWALSRGHLDVVEVIELAMRQREAIEEKQHLTEAVKDYLMPDEKHCSAHQEEGQKQRRKM